MSKIHYEKRIDILKDAHKLASEILTYKFVGKGGLTNDPVQGYYDTVTYFHPGNDNRDAMIEVSHSLRSHLPDEWEWQLLMEDLDEVLDTMYLALEGSDDCYHSVHRQQAFAIQFITKKLEELKS